jgi:hypothetical protein
VTSAEVAEAIATGHADAARDAAAACLAALAVRC